MILWGKNRRADKLNKRQSSIFGFTFQTAMLAVSVIRAILYLNTAFTEYGVTLAMIITDHPTTAGTHFNCMYNMHGTEHV